ncbi:hypothetical protein U1Q18_026765 [Sarracenia purpurea var. burkii]
MDEILWIDYWILLTLQSLHIFIHKYRLRSKVDIENVAEAFSCWQRYGRNPTEKSSSTEELDAASVGWGTAVDQSGVLASQGNDLGWQCIRIPDWIALDSGGSFHLIQHVRFNSLC